MTRRSLSICLLLTIPIIIPRAVAAVVTGLRHRHLQVVGIRLLLVFVRITVGGDRFCSLTRLDGIGQILDGRFFFSGKPPTL